MHTSPHPRTDRIRSSTVLAARPHGSATASVCATRALLVRPGKRKSEALTARLDAVKQRMLDLA